ncbi:MAG: polyketide cyclase [Rheinheimera sp.]|nr:MAG: polyketide cyclase [Rheinheimera sp.]
MPENNTSDTFSTANTFSTSRILPFPASAIFNAFADAKQLAAWWGPAGFINHFELFEFKPQGRWHFVMQGPDGQQYPNQSFFAELAANRKIVIRHDCVPFFTLTVELTPLEADTVLHWQQVFDDADIAQAVRHIVEPANEQNLDRLTAELQRAAAGQP